MARQAAAAQLIESLDTGCQLGQERAALACVPSGILRSTIADTVALLLPELSYVRVADQLPALLVPEVKRQALQAGPQRDGLDLLEQPLALVAVLQVVVGNARAQMVDVVEADTGREPLQHAGQLVEGAAAQRRRRVIPVVAALPVGVFELMLHVEEPNARGARHQQDYRLNQQVRPNAEDPAHQTRRAEQHQVHPPDRAALSPACLG